MVAFWLDVRYGARTLLKVPAFAGAAIVTLALGIGANTMIFSVTDALLLRPLPYQDPGRVAFLLGWDVPRDQMRFNVSRGDYLDLRDSVGAFERTAAYTSWSANLTGAGLPERVQAYRVTADIFRLLGVQPILGRSFLEEEGVPGAAGVVVLGHALWTSRLGASPEIVGSRVTLDGQPHTVIGVMPPGFEFPQLNFKGDLWAPLALDASGAAADRGARTLVALARLRGDRSVAQAQAEVDALFGRLARELPDSNAGFGVRVLPMSEMVVQPIKPALIVLTATVGLVLMVACANITSMLLARAVGRRKEIAIRVALGAGRARILRQLLTESLLMAALGAAAGLILAAWGLAAFSAATPEFVSKTLPAVDGIRVDLRALAFTTLAALAAGLLSGLAPALQISRADRGDSLQQAGRSSSAQPRWRLRGALVVAEIALSLMLLAGAGLLIRSFLSLTRVEPGFDELDVLTMEMSLPDWQHPEPRHRAEFIARALGRIASLPNVEAAGAVNSMPFSTSNASTSFHVEGAEPAPGQAPRTDYRIVSLDYFRALRIPVLSGRAFTEADAAEAPPVVLVNRTLARRHFGEDSPIDRRIRFGPPSSPSPWHTVVGVVGDVRHSSLAEAPSPEVYAPLDQDPPARITMVVRATADLASLAGAVRRSIHSLAPDQPVYAVQTMSEAIATSLLPQRLPAILMALFAGIALVLASVGIYGLVSYSVSERTHEIGVRMALGASPREILRMMLRQGMALVLFGLLIGVGAALALARLLAGLLFGVGPADPITFAAISMVLLAVAVLACWLPARRASRVDPMVALRYE